VDKDRDVQYGIGTQIAQANTVIPQQIQQERMDGNFETARKVTCEHYKFVAIQSWEELTACRSPPRSGPVWKHTIEHQLINGGLIGD
jgi:hypothetical protein